MAKSQSKTKDSIAKRKKVMASINRLLKEHDLGHLKVVELHLTPRSLAAAKSFSNCENLQCGPDETKVEVRLPNGTIRCICV